MFQLHKTMEMKWMQYHAIYEHQFWETYYDSHSLAKTNQAYRNYKKIEA